MNFVLELYHQQGFSMKEVLRELYWIFYKTLIIGKSKLRSTTGPNVIVGLQVSWHSRHTIYHIQNRNLTFIHPAQPSNDRHIIINCYCESQAGTLIRPPFCIHRLFFSYSDSQGKLFFSQKGYLYNERR